MKLFVYVLEGRGWAVKDAYVKLRLGKYKFKTRLLRNTENPHWNEEFAFRVNDLEEELVVSVYEYNNHEPGFFNVSQRELVGRVKIPIWSVATEENQSFAPTWFSLERTKNWKSTESDCGKLLLALSLHGRNQETSGDHVLFVPSTSVSHNSSEMEPMPTSSRDSSQNTSLFKKPHDRKPLMKVVAGRLEKIFSKKEETSSPNDTSSERSLLSDYEDSNEELPVPIGSNFQESLEIMQSKNENRKTPDNLPGGVLLDQTYVASPEDLNAVLFAPGSEFIKDLAELQGTTDFQEGPWTWKSDDNSSCLTRVVTYIKAASKLVKAVKATEEQTYVKADGKEFAIHVIVNTPDVPYGSSFKVELLYKIMPGNESGCARLIISWAVNFTQSTMMKGMIENGVKQGLKDNFEQFASLLSQRFKAAGDVSDKDHVLAALENEHNSDWELAIRYFGNLTTVSTVFILLYTIIHIFLCKPSKPQGLEFGGLDLPDSFGEIITCGILILQLERVYYMIVHFVEARLRKGNDRGVKAQGDGWILTVALIEGVNLVSVGPTDVPDPYVVFTCNGKTRTSSVKLHAFDPQWNEILEFDAEEEPPSVLDVEVFDFDGPFDQASSLGHAEINFLKHTSTELADLWVPLSGKLAQSSQSKLHLRIFLDNNNGVETLRDYLSNLEKEVGKKLHLRSPHRNSTFQKIFGLPPDEFLISDFACSLRRKMPLQGRLFLSARIVGFHANLFGYKTKFFFLWEDIEDIQVLPPSFASVGSPLLVIVLHKGRGLDARHGAKTLDEEGRLHFHFHSFVSFGAASRTIMALWRTRTLEPDQKAQTPEEQTDDEEKPCLLEDTGSHLVNEDVKMTKVYSEELPINLESLMRLFDGGELEHQVMSKSGCLNYTTTRWEQVSSNVEERHVCYKFNRRISIFGGEVTCTQQKSPSPNDDGWIVTEIMALNGVPFSDRFQVQFRYQMHKSSSTNNSCRCEVYIGVLWLKNTKFQPRVTKNIIGKFTHRLEEILQLVERDIAMFY